MESKETITRASSCAALHRASSSFRGGAVHRIGKRSATLYCWRSWQRRVRRLYVRKGTGNHTTARVHFFFFSSIVCYAMIAASGRRGLASSGAAGGEPEAPPPYRESPPPSSPIRMHSGSGPPSSVHTRASAGGRSYPRRASRPSAAQAGLNRHYSAVVEALESPPAALASLASSSTAAARGGDPLSHRPRRGTPLVRWVWPSNASASVIAKAGSSESNSHNNSSTNVMEGVGGRRGESNSRCYQENAKRRMMPGLHQRGRHEAPTVVLSGVVTGKICEPVRPTRLDLSANQGERQERCSRMHGTRINS